MVKEDLVVQLWSPWAVLSEHILVKSKISRLIRESLDQIRMDIINDNLGLMFVDRMHISPVSIFNLYQAIIMIKIAGYVG